MSDTIVYSDVQFKQNLDHKDEGKGINSNKANVEDVTYSEIKTGRGKQVDTNDANKGSVPAPSDPSPPAAQALKCTVGVLSCLCVLLLGLAVGLGVYVSNMSRVTDLEDCIAQINQTLTDTKLELFSLHANHTRLRMETQSIREQRDQLSLNLTQLSTDLANVTVHKVDTANQLQECLTNVTKLRVKGCPDGWDHYNGSCYFFSTDKLTWVQSQYACISDGGHLVIIETEREEEFLRQKVGSADFDNSFWIGLTDAKQEGVWVWMDNSTLTNGTRPKYWDEPEPNNDDSGQPENCARIGQVCNKRSNCWFDNRCDRKSKRICESQAAY